MKTIKGTKYYGKKDIANILGCSVTTIEKYMKNCGICETAEGYTMEQINQLATYKSKQ